TEATTRGSGAGRRSRATGQAHATTAGGRRATTGVHPTTRRRRISGDRARSTTGRRRSTTGVHPTAGRRRISGDRARSTTSRGRAPAAGARATAGRRRISGDRVRSTASRGRAPAAGARATAGRRRGRSGVHPAGRWPAGTTFTRAHAWTAALATIGFPVIHFATLEGLAALVAPDRRRSAAVAARRRAGGATPSFVVRRGGAPGARLILRTRAPGDRAAAAVVAVVAVPARSEPVPAVVDHAVAVPDEARSVIGVAGAARRPVAALPVPVVAGPIPVAAHPVVAVARGRRLVLGDRIGDRARRVDRGIHSRRLGCRRRRLLLDVHRLLRRWRLLGIGRRRWRRLFHRDRRRLGCRCDVYGSRTNVATCERGEHQHQRSVQPGAQIHGDSLEVFSSRATVTRCPSQQPRKRKMAKVAASVGTIA